MIKLSEREQQVLDLLKKGMTAKKISENIFLTESAVKQVKYRLYKIYNVKTGSQLLAKQGQNE